MELLCEINDRKVYYSHVVGSELPASFPKEDICILGVIDEVAEDRLNEFADTALMENVRYVCAAGKRGNDLENAFDLAAIRHDNFVMTTTHASLEEGMWFACTVAHHEDVEIKSVLCLLLDGSEENKESIIKAAQSVKSGWMPED